jgi:hypothetical protein
MVPDTKGTWLVINDKEKEKETLYVDETKGDSSSTQAQTTRGRMGRRIGASIRSYTTIAMPPLLHQGMTR